MKITKRQLRRIIREAMVDEPIRMVPGDSFSSSGRSGQLKSYAQMEDDGSYYKDVIVMSPNADSVLIDGEEVYIENVPDHLEKMGFPMKGNDPDNLIFALEEQHRDGYVELAIKYENGVWSW